MQPHWNYVNYKSVIVFKVTVAAARALPVTVET